MRVLVIGGGGREHALAWRCAQDPGVRTVYCAPGNAGAMSDVSCIPANVLDPKEIASLAETLGAGCTVVGPEAPLVAGVADELESKGIPVVGPCQAAAQLEASKAFSKDFLVDCGIPTAESTVLESQSEIDATVGRFGYPVALKADGLAAGKGVIIAQDASEARSAARKMLAGALVGDAGRRIVVEQFLDGEEVSFMVLSDGKTFKVLPATQDHKRALDGDRGLNTGGMGAYCDDAILDTATSDQIVAEVIEPTLAGMRRRGQPFKGFLYCGLMLTDVGPKVLEFNVRLGDPETQPMLFRIDGGFAELLASAARGELDSSLTRVDSQPTACVVMASGGYPGKYETGKPISGLREAESSCTKVFHAGTKLVDGRIVTSGGRVLGVTARGEHLRESLANAYQAVQAIDFAGAHYRRDIGRRGLQRIQPSSSR